ncbi:hypothetical protein KCP69_25560 [Salmonella enterica subsp. enterica]|nr:hypothetical protein KCP69_25560 [Salmonella enterica subsp. enterica]
MLYIRSTNNGLTGQRSIYILPGIGIATKIEWRCAARWDGCRAPSPSSSCRLQPAGVTAGVGFGRRQPGVSPDYRMVKSQMRDGDPVFAVLL